MTRVRATAAPVVRAEMLTGADVDPQTGALLSVAQLQAALRAGDTGRRCPQSRPALSEPVRSDPAGQTADRLAEPRLVSPDPGPIGSPVPTWLAGLPGPVLVVGAHPSAGCSTVAVALAEAAADGAGGHLIECADAAASGLAGVSRTELGVGPSGQWRHGRRGDLTVSRPVNVLPATPPDPGPAPAVTVVDLGHRPGLAEAVGGWAGPVVVVCRASVPGIRRVETVLAALAGSALVAVVGPPRWPGPVRASRGAHLRRQEQAGALVCVPQDKRLAVTGLTSGRLPRRVAAAGRRLWQLTLTRPPGPAGSATAAVSTWMTEQTPTGAQQ